MKVSIGKWSRAKYKKFSFFNDQIHLTYTNLEKNLSINDIVELICRKFQHEGDNNYMYVIYFLIGFLATLLGASAGLGGGVIIKPVLDLFGHYDIGTIGFLSAATVFSMASVSLLRARKNNIRIEKAQSILIAVGSIIGGFFGKSIFNYFVDHETIGEMIGLIQSGLLVTILVLILIFIKFHQHFTSYHIKNRLVIILVGFILGVLSSFIGIGGGPLNVAILGWLFSMNTKNAVFNSIFIIFFSQLTAIVLVIANMDVQSYDLSMLPVMIVG